MLMYFNMIWPERRAVSESQIIVWASDAIANKEINEEFSTAVESGDAMTCAEALHEAGLITLAR